MDDMQPYYSDGAVTIYHGDCRDVLPTLSADVTITDPPYGVGKASWDSTFHSDWLLAASAAAPLLGLMGYGNWIPCLVYAADGVSIYRQASDAARISVGHEPKPDHPSPKPYRVMSWLVAQLSREGQAIVDPFSGSGTTLLAAKALGRRAIGIELEERYCEIAAQRLSQEILPLDAA